MFQNVLLCLAFQAWATTTSVTPIEKVVMMIKDMQTECAKEGHDEAVTYDKFACFCKAKTDEKSTAIKEAEVSVKRLRAALDGAHSLRTNLNGQIDDCNDNINHYEEELKNATIMRKTEKLAYEAAFADMAKAVSAIESAIVTLKSSKLGGDGALKVNRVYNLASIKKTVSKALLIADAMGMENKHTKAAKAFLMQIPSGGQIPQLQGAPGNFVPRSDYDFHSGDIIETLEGLLATFRSEKTDLEEEEVSTKAAFDSAAQAKKDQVTQEQEILNGKEKKLADTTAKISATNQELTEMNAILNDDRTYLHDLTANCEEKARMWDQRSTLRADELGAITSALSVLEGAVKNQAVLTGQGGRTPIITTALQTPDEDEIPTVTPVSFIQVKPDKRVQSALTLLRKMSKKLSSHALSALANKVEEDPFAKVKTLIQELIERLLTEASDEANQKGWCDTEQAKGMKDRDYRVRDLDELESTLMELYSRKIELESLDSKLLGEIKGLKADLLNATQVRQEEKAENKETVANANLGEKAVTQALDILSHFYGEANQAEVAEAAPLDANFTDGAPERESVVTDAPDAGFDGAYKGAQSVNTGIIGMLEVIRGDFQRTARDTTMDEEQSLRAFVDYERQNKASTAAKIEAKANTVRELSKVNTDINTDVADYQTKQNLLDGAIDTLEGLHPVCQGSREGMSYEDRSDRRKEEIEALKSALCILDDGQGDYCGASFLQKARKIA